MQEEDDRPGKKGKTCDHWMHDSSFMTRRSFASSTAVQMGEGRVVAEEEEREEEGCEGVRESKRLAVEEEEEETEEGEGEGGL